MERGEATAAIPLLCEILIDSDLESPFQPIVWIDLARCLSASGERLLEFIALREGSRLRNLLGLSDQEEREELGRFVDDPEAVFGRLFPRDRRIRFGLRAQGYKKAGLPTQALDCYTQGLICQGGSSGGVWFQMGECFAALGELWLAELFFRKAASLMLDINLREKFLGKAKAVRRERRANDPGLAIERRRADRTRSDPPDLCIVDPVEARRIYLQISPGGRTGGKGGAGGVLRVSLKNRNNIACRAISERQLRSLNGEGDFH